MAKTGTKTIGAECTKAKHPRQWSLGLLESMKDPECVIKQTERIVVIKDKYPKAKIHYLVLPQEDISSIFKLDSTHLCLLEEFDKIFQELKSKHNGVELQSGFHAIPSMQRLHMHVISKDMISPCLKTKIHWNSFTTKFFIPYSDLLQELKETGGIKRISKEQHEEYITTPLVCNQCSYKPKNMPQLKEHLLTHSMQI